MKYEGFARFARFSSIAVVGILLVHCGSSDPAPSDSATGGTGGGGTGGASGGLGGLGGTGLTGQGASDGSGGVYSGPPLLLSETGLYASDGVTLGAGVGEFSPQFVLWSDGATKKRYVYLPPDSTIDTTDMDFWEYPEGTKLWKEFSRDGKRIETRLLQKKVGGGWWRVAYLWREDQTEADAVPLGVENASGTEHDVPSSDQCIQCHALMEDNVLGFSAIQLSHSGSGVTLQTLIDSGRLSAPPAGPFTLPGTEVEKAAFGYLHANCGNCHHEGGAPVSLDVWMRTGELASVTTMKTYTTTVGVDIQLTDSIPPNASKRVVAKDPEHSALFLRAATRGEAWSMPPLGTELPDQDGKDALEAWIDSL